MSYLTFGPEVKTVVLLNLPDSRTLQVVQFLYSAAILLSVPLQLFPAVRIMETGLFPHKSGKADPRVKWTKNLFRTAVVLVCACVAYLGAADLDKFVALIGSFACVPLCYVYPPMLHLRACARTRKQKAADWALIVFGIVAAVYTTVQTLTVSVLLFFVQEVCADASLTAYSGAFGTWRWQNWSLPRTYLKHAYYHLHVRSMGYHCILWTRQR
jgi:proton-coupled amino acid transporter